MTIVLRPTEPADEQFLYDVYGSTRIAEPELVNWRGDEKVAFVRQQFERKAGTTASATRTLTMGP